MAVTANFSWPYPATSDSPNGPAQISALAIAADTSLKTTDLSARDKPVFANRKTVTQNVTHNTDTPITWPAADDIDTVGGHNPSSNSSRYTIQAGWGGRYRSEVEIDIAGNATGIRDIEFRVNSVAVAYRRNHYVGLSAANMTIRTGGVLPVNLVAGDYIEVYVNQTSGGTLGFGGAGHTATWDVEFLSR